MPDEDQRPSLEPPRLFGRKKKARSNVEPERDEEPTAAIPVPEPEPTPVPQPEPLPEPEPIPEPEPAPEPEPSPAPLPDDVGPAAEELPEARTLVTGAPLFVDEATPDRGRRG